VTLSQKSGVDFFFFIIETVLLMSTDAVVRSTATSPEDVPIAQVLTQADVGLKEHKSAEAWRDLYSLEELFLAEEHMLELFTPVWQSQIGTKNPLLYFPSDRADLMKLDDFATALNKGKRLPPQCFECIGEKLSDKIKSLQRWFSRCPTMPSEDLFLKWGNRSVHSVQLQDPSLYTNLRGLLTNQSESGTAIHIHSGPVLDSLCEEHAHAAETAPKQGRRLLLLLQATLRDFDATSMPVPTRAVFIAHAPNGEDREGTAPWSLCNAVSNWDSQKQNGVPVAAKTSGNSNSLMCASLAVCDLAWFNRLLATPFAAIRNDINQLRSFPEKGFEDFVQIDLTDIVKNGHTKNNFLAWMVAQYYPYFVEQTLRKAIAAAEKSKGPSPESIAEVQIMKGLQKEDEMHFAWISRTVLLHVLSALEKKSGKGRLMDAHAGFGLDVRIAGGKEKARAILREMDKLKTQAVRDDIDEKTNEIVRLQFRVDVEFLCLSGPDRLPSALLHEHKHQQVSAALTLSLQGNKRSAMPPLGRTEDLLRRRQQETSPRLIEAEEYQRLYGSR
jgi:hypothetical protein